MRIRLCRTFISGGLALTLGCGSYVKYEGDPAAAGSVSVATSTDASTGIEIVDGQLDHWVFSAVLARFVRSDGAQTLVDYDALKKNGTALELLDSYRVALANIDPDQLEGKDQKLAFWFNAYNANVIAGVLAEYQTKAEYTVLDSGTFFNSRRFKVAGIDIALDEIENGVLRGDTMNATVNASPDKAKLLAWHASLWAGATVDPRLHVAVNCAALSCPNLQSKAWDPKTLDTDLEAAMKAFLADPKKGAGADGISSLFEWYKADFVGAAGSAASYIEQHREGGLEGVSADRQLTYDWTLNIAR